MRILRHKSLLLLPSCFTVPFILRSTPTAPSSAFITTAASVSLCCPCRDNTSHYSASLSVSRRPPYSSLLQRPELRACFSVAAEMQEERISYLSQKEAAAIDEVLMGPLGFSVEQLMELAGLSVAASIAEVYKSIVNCRVIVLCGPGNNGGDGLVAARHLYHFGYQVFICYPKQTARPLYSGLVTQLESLSIPFLSVEDFPQNLSDRFDIIIDALFGFSFHGTPRPPFDDLIQRISLLNNIDSKIRSFPAVISIDVPSGWHVEEGDISGEGIKPDMLISLTAPKLCAKKFTGPHHFLGGRFVPPSIKEKFGLQLPPYPGTSMCVRIGKAPSGDLSTLRVNYVSHALLENQMLADPTDQFCKWFDEVVAAGLRDPNAMALATSSKDGRISSRMVLLKGVDEQGFVWYTNYGSRKAQDLSENSFAALLFYWDPLNRQVRIEGSVEKVSFGESELYFQSRPRESQLGAIVSKQSTPIVGREVLDEAYREIQAKYIEGVIPKPSCWGGYRLKPILFEFWQGQTRRLHDRIQYSLREVEGKHSWHIVRLAP